MNNPKMLNDVREINSNYFERAKSQKSK